MLQVWTGILCLLILRLAGDATFIVVYSCWKFASVIAQTEIHFISFYEIVSMCVFYLFQKSLPV